MPAITRQPRGGRVSEGWPAFAAAATVFLLVGIQLARSSVGGGVGAASYGREFERLIADKAWDAAALDARGRLISLPLERRLHFYYGRCMLERGFPAVAIEHVVLAATVVPEALHKQLLAPPSAGAVKEVRAALAERFPDYVQTDLGRLHEARLAALEADWVDWRRDVDEVTAACDGGVQEGSPCPGLEAFASVATGVDAERWAEAGLDEAACEAVLQAAGAKFVPRAALRLGAAPGVATLGMLAGGVFSGDRHLVVVAGAVHEFSPRDGWLLVRLDPASGAVRDTTRLPLTALSDEAASLRAWFSAEPGPAVFAGCAAGEVVAGLSAAGRKALAEVVGLEGVPPTDSLRAYAFVVHRTDSALVHAEAVSVTAVMPAMLIAR